MRKLISLLLVVLFAGTAYATPYIHNHVNADGALAASPDPAQTVLISDNASHIFTVTNQIWYDLFYNGTGGCIVRLMKTNAKASYPAEPVSTGTKHSYIIHGNTNFINYSGCNSGTAPNNSVLHLM